MANNMEFAPLSDEEMKLAEQIDQPDTEVSQFAELSDEEKQMVAGLQGQPEFAPLTEEEMKIVSQSPDTVASARLANVSPQGEAPGTIDSIISGGSRGIRETLMPGTMTKQEIEKTGNLTEIASQFFASMGIDLAASATAAGVGARIGSLFGPATAAAGALVGLGSYAVFGAYNQETIAETRTGEFSKGRMAARALLSLNPMLRYGGKVTQGLLKSAPRAAAALAKTESGIARTGRLAAQVAGETGVAASEFGEEHIKTAAGISFILHGLAFRKGHGISPAQSKALTETALTDDMISVAGKAADAIEALPPQKRIFNQDKMSTEFINYVLHQDLGIKFSPENKTAALRHLKGQKGQELYDNFLFRKKMTAAAQQLADDLEGQLTNLGVKTPQDKVKQKERINQLKKTNLFFRDSNVVASSLDNVTHQGYSKSLNTLSRHNELYNIHRTEILDEAIKASSLTKKAGLSPEDMGSLRVTLSEQGIDSAKSRFPDLFDAEGALIPKVDLAVTQWNKAYAKAATIMKSYGFNIEEIQHYSPRVLMNRNQLTDFIVDVGTEIQNRVPLINKPLRKWKVADLTGAGVNMDKASAHALMSNINTLRAHAKRYGIKSLDVSQLDDLKNASLKVSRKGEWSAQVSAAFGRSDADSLVPEQLREMDVNQQFLAYMRGSFKAAIMDKPLREMETHRAVAQKLGLNNVAENIQASINASVGSGRDGKISDVKDWFATKLNQAEYWAHRGILESQKRQTSKIDLAESFNRAGFQITDKSIKMLAGWQAVLYPSVLGFNLPAIVRDVASGVFQNTSLLGGTYGYKAVTRAMLTNPMKYAKRMESLGMTSGAFRAEAMERGLDTLNSKINRTIGKASDIALSFYGVSDKFNRNWSFATGHIMAGDLARGDAQAIAALKKLGGGAISALRGAGFKDIESFKKNVDQVGDILGEYLTSRAQHHYGAEQRSQFLQEMGPFFSLFTKWPSSQLSEILQIIQESPTKRQALSRMGERYLAPVALMMAVAANSDPDSTVMQYLMPNPVKMAPMMAALDYSVTNHPLFSFIIGSSELAKHFLENPEPAAFNLAAKKLLKNIAKTGVPGLSSALNEIDRFKKAQGDTQLSTEIINNLLGD